MLPLGKSVATMGYGFSRLSVPRTFEQSHNFEQFVEGRRSCRWARKGIEGARIFVCHALCHGEAIRTERQYAAPPRVYALQRVKSERP
jgi:hypothetical protein